MIITRRQLKKKLIMAKGEGLHLSMPEVYYYWEGVLSSTRWFIINPAVKVHLESFIEGAEKLELNDTDKEMLVDLIKNEIYLIWTPKVGSNILKYDGRIYEIWWDRDKFLIWELIK